jgi:photosystem II stability/assembly factor-like uncharacterized protein
MRIFKCLCFCLFFFVIACTGSKEDEEITSQTAYSQKKMVTFENLFGVASYGIKDAWVVGYEGVIFHTGDGGAKWEQQKAPVETDFYDVCFIDSQNGWITGKSGTILHTANGGKNWQQQISQTEQRLFDAHFVNAQTGWAVGTLGTILHTTDGGETWLKQGFGEDRYYNGVFFIDEQRGWIVGEYASLLYTENGGKDWVEQECKDIIPEEPELDFAPPPPTLYGVYFISPDTGWATGMDGIIIKTEDGGKNWKQLAVDAEFAIYKISIIGNKGWAIGDRAEYLVSHDSGNTWKKQNIIKTKFWLKDLAVSDENHVWIVGAYGAILNTIDGGQNWNVLSGTFIQ